MPQTVAHVGFHALIDASAYAASSEHIDEPHCKLCEMRSTTRCDAERACSMMTSVLWMFRRVTLLPVATLTGPVSSSRSSQHMKVVSLQPQMRMCCVFHRRLVSALF